VHLNTAGTELGSKLNKHMFVGKRKLSIIYEHDKRKSEKKNFIIDFDNIKRSLYTVLWKRRKMK